MRNDEFNHFIYDQLLILEFVVVFIFYFYFICLDEGQKVNKVLILALHFTLNLIVSEYRDSTWEPNKLP
jgi:hypothetical protein